MLHPRSSIFLFVSLAVYVQTFFVMKTSHLWEKRKITMNQRTVEIGRVGIFVSRWTLGVESPKIFSLEDNPLLSGSTVAVNCPLFIYKLFRGVGCTYVERKS